MFLSVLNPHCDRSIFDALNTCGTCFESGSTSAKKSLQVARGSLQYKKASHVHSVVATLCTDFCDKSSLLWWTTAGPFTSKGSRLLASK